VGYISDGVAPCLRASRRWLFIVDSSGEETRADGRTVAGDDWRGDGGG